MTDSELSPLADLGGGLWRISVPIMGLPVVATHVYVLESTGGPVLIDAGWPDSVAWAALTAGLGEIGVAVRDVRGVVVTHFHPDHAGLSGDLREASGCWIAGHEADADLMRKVEAVPDMLAWEADNLRRAGAPEADVQAYVSGGGGGGLASPPAKVDIELSDGDMIDVPGRRLRVIWTPGHSPGHVCLYLEDAGQLFTGDHVLSKTTPHIGLYPYDLPGADPLGDFLDGLDRVKELTVSEVLPAHEHPVTDLPSRADEIKDHHAARLRLLRSTLADAPLTLWEACARLDWSQPWDKMNAMSRQLAAAEAAAHLARLREDGQVRQVPGPGPARFTVA
jgi:glyoxylase-like metal-dependent hydrolase (beta-lactamase superfamily II)